MRLWAVWITVFCIILVPNYNRLYYLFFTVSAVYLKLMTWIIVVWNDCKVLNLNYCCVWTSTELLNLNKFHILQWKWKWTILMIKNLLDLFEKSTSKEKKNPSFISLTCPCGAFYDENNDLYDLWKSWLRTSAFILQCTNDSLHRNPSCQLMGSRLNVLERTFTIVTHQHEGDLAQIVPSSWAFVSGSNIDGATLPC